MKRLLPLLLLVPGLLRGADVVPDDRKTYWDLCGPPGGIPYRTTVYTNVSGTFTMGNLQTWIDNCPSNQVIQLPAGTNSYTGYVKISQDHITIRGTTNQYGEPTTVFNMGTSAGGWAVFDMSKINLFDNDENWTSCNDVNLFAAPAKGATRVSTTSAASGVTKDSLIRLDQLTNYPVMSINSMMREGNRAYSHWALVTNVVNTTNYDFWPPIAGNYWSMTNTPQMVFHGSYTGGDEVTRWTGIEDIKIVRSTTGGQSTVNMGPAAFCWARNCWLDGCSGEFSGNSLIKMADSAGCAAVDCYIINHYGTASSGYATYVLYSSYSLIQNCVIVNCANMYTVAAVSAAVFSYNFGTNMWWHEAWHLPESVNASHGNYCDMQLFEGNVVPSMNADVYHGNAGNVLYARNRSVGWESGRTDGNAFDANEGIYFITCVGNVAGWDAYHTTDSQMFNIGSTSTFIRTNNWGTVADAIDYSLGSGVVLSNSYYLASKPAWIGNLGWPPIEPTDSAKRFLLPTTWTNSIPAAYRFYTGRFPPAAEGGEQTTPATLRAGSLRVTGSISGR